MKINTNIDRYDIRSLDEVELIVRKMHNRAEALSELGTIMRNRLNGAAIEFTSVNYTRVSDACDDYIKKMNKMETELNELATSIKQFTDKIREIWN